jgi:hypothetical protein
MVWQSFKDFLFFRRMVWPLFIHVIFLFYFAVAAIAFPVLLVSGRAREGFGVLGGVFALRLVLEFVMVLFRASETLTSIRNRLATPLPRSVAPPPSPAPFVAPPPAPAATARSDPSRDQTGRQTFPAAAPAAKVDAEKDRVFCIECGAVNPRDNGFCESCGKPLIA